MERRSVGVEAESAAGGCGMRDKFAVGHALGVLVGFIHEVPNMARVRVGADGAPIGIYNVIRKCFLVSSDELPDLVTVLTIQPLNINGEEVGEPVDVELRR